MIFLVGKEKEARYYESVARSSKQWHGLALGFSPCSILYLDGVVTQMKEFVLTRWKWKPGMAIQRYGDWRNGEPQVIIDNQTWNKLGMPEVVKITLES